MKLATANNSLSAATEKSDQGASWGTDNQENLSRRQLSNLC